MSIVREEQRYMKHSSNRSHFLFVSETPDSYWNDWILMRISTSNSQCEHTLRMKLLKIQYLDMKHVYSRSECGGDCGTNYAV